MHKEVKELISEQKIEEIVEKIGMKITKHYRDIGGDLIIIGLLRGSFIFMADLVRKINYPTIIDFMTVSSYGNKKESSGNIKIVMDLDESIKGKHVLIIEDIIDTGNTFSKILSILQAREPKSLKVCTFLNKPSKRIVDIKIDFCGVDIEDEFVVGYGLDFAQKYRNLPFIGILE